MSRKLANCSLWGLLSLAAPGFSLQTAPSTSDFTNPFDEVTNFNVETVRGMGWDAQNRLWAINTHGSTLVRFDSGFTGLEEIYRTVNNPVAMDFWTDGSFDYPIVAGGGTHAVVRHEPISGTVQALIRTPSEVGDLVVDQEAGEVFVSCPGANVVLQLSLPNLNVIRTIEIPAIRPRFLFLEEGAVDNGQDNRVYVAPFLSGNNSAFGAIGTMHAGKLVDASDPSIADQGLPDEDLFRIDPTTGSVEPVLTGAGTLLTAHGMHPNGDYWMLSVDANNVAHQSEPSVNGRASFNKLQIWESNSSGAFALSSDIDLDDTAPGTGAYSSAYSASFPFALEFHHTQTGIIASSTGDKLIEVDVSGNRAGSQSLVPGSIPRDLLFDASGSYLYVYLWGTNEVRRFSYPFGTADSTVSLGLDPTPPSVKRGREIWYDADRSEHARSTCNSCHPAGGTDNLAWNLENAPLDHKGILTTQSLLSIEDTFPYHWRGERNLEDFNMAFPGLLGAQKPLSGPDFKDLEAFIFSLQAPANPNQSDARYPDDTLTAGPYPDLRSGGDGVVVGRATVGETVFRNELTFFGQAACVECHIPKSGGLGDMIAERGSQIPEALHLDVAHLRQLKNKEMPPASVVFLDDNAQTMPPVERPLTGFAITHDGQLLDINHFLSGIAFHMDGQQTADVTAFVRQFDQGIAPAAHAAVSMRFGNVVEAHGEVQALITNQVNVRWIDLAVRGRVTTSAGPRDMGWVFDSGTSKFLPDDPMATVVVGASCKSGPLDLDDFAVQAVFGSGNFVFYGLPPGNGERFGRDADNDALADGEELYQHDTDPWNPHTDPDIWPDGYEIANGSDPLIADTPNDTTVHGAPTFTLDYSTARGANLFVEFDEPVTYTVTYSTPGGPVLQHQQLDPVRRGTLMLQSMQPSSPMVAPTVAQPFPPAASQLTYSGSIQLTDLAMNTMTYAIPDMTTQDAIDPAVAAVVVDEFFWASSPVRLEGAMNGVAKILIKPVIEGDGPEVEGRNVILQVLTKLPNQNVWTAKGSADVVGSVPLLEFDAPLPGFHPGPYLISPLTDSQGLTTLPITINNLAMAEEVRVKVVAVLEDTATDAGFSAFSGQAYQMPATPFHLRTLDE